MKKNHFIFIFLICISSVFSNETNVIKPMKQKDNEEIITSENLSIRQIGNETLHNQVKLANFNDRDKILASFEIMQNYQEKLGGVGIAQNQCKDIEEPIQMILIGTNDPETRDAIKKRYPNFEIPSLMVMINPRILEYSKETYFPEYGEGCLSVAGPLRGKVKRHKAIKVEYFDIDGDYHLEEYFDFAAHVIQHECDHLAGTVFLEKIFDKLLDKQAITIAKLLEQEIEYRKLNHFDSCEADESAPILVFDIDSSKDSEEVIIHFDSFAKVLKKMPNETLYGIQKVLLLNNNR